MMSKRVIVWVNQYNTLDANMKSTFKMVLGQFTDHMRSNMEALDTWGTLKQDFNLLTLLTYIKKLSYKYNEDTKNHNVAYHELLRRFQNLWQGDLTPEEY